MISPPKLQAIVERHGARKRRPPRESACRVIGALVYHCLQGRGPLANQYGRLWGHGLLSNAALSKRRLAMPAQLFEELLRVALVPLAQIQKHPECFYQGLRLIAVDGTEFSLSNTPQVLGKLTKAACRRLEAAFAKLGLCVVVEVGTHNPIAAAIGEKGNCELALAASLWARIPAKCLLLADRLYGTPKAIATLAGQLEPRQSQWLVRVRNNLKRTVVRCWEDGSAQIEVKGPEGDKLVLREIRAWVRKPGMKQASEVRLWTSLLDWRAHRAPQLLELYARRWEGELYYRQLKLELHSGELLQSHTVHTAAQELASLVMASALVARRRIECAQACEIEPLRVSFAKVWEATRALWHLLDISQSILSAKQIQQIVQAQMDELDLTALLPKRRQRRCPRAVRQPVKKWPRLVHNQSEQGPADYEIIPNHIE